MAHALFPEWETLVLDKAVANTSLGASASASGHGGARGSSDQDILCWGRDSLHRGAWEGMDDSWHGRGSCRGEEEGVGC